MQAILSCLQKVIWRRKVMERILPHATPGLRRKLKIKNFVWPRNRNRYFSGALEDLDDPVHIPLRGLIRALAAPFLVNS